VTIHDTKAVEIRDLGAQFYLSQEDVGQNRAEACREKLQELNTAVEVAATTQDLTADFIGGFQVCVYGWCWVRGKGCCRGWSMQHGA